ncbi:DUF4012 domain-containing protein [Sinomonas gamaensis]|uniref:DUF4012 domain-containing protein n=1 Tax=Sinomonas gamaensis TaxID=2565624 RepID=UPI001485D068|nr:DUF4012 domain-containing protein [Sinomonas gamaensis]
MVVIACSVWLGARALLAQREIAESERLAKVVQTQLLAGQADQAKESAASLTSHVDSARAYVTDPLWQVAGLLPLIGTNFSASAKMTAILSDVAHGAVLPLSSVASNVNPSTIKPANGALDLGTLVAAQPAIARANGVLHNAYVDVTSLEPGFGALPQVIDGVDRFKTVLSDASEQVSAADNVAGILPSMLGDSRPRTYLVLFQNNAELRATGGIPGAAAEVRVDHGHITLGRQTAAKDIRKFPQPVLPLADQTKGLYGEITGQYFQDVNLVPQFPLTARLAGEMWKQQFGTQVDGVISLDPVALGYILQATGPVKLPSGDVLDSSNAVRLLLSDAYAKYEGLVVQKDDFFSAAAASVFSKISAGGFQPKPMIDALNRAGRERRLLVWSSDQKEQEVIEKANVSGALPPPSPAQGTFGVYLNDATGSKMDYYLRETYRAGGVVCRADGRPTWEVEITLTNAAPADAAKSLPEYVTGGGAFGVQPGYVKTQVNVYAPPAGIFTNAWLDGAPLDVHRDMDSGYPVAQTQTLLAPRQSATLKFQFLGAPGADAKPNLVSTPTVNNFQKSDLSLTCPDVVR